MTKWTHTRITHEALDRLKLVSALSRVPVSTILSIFAEEAIKVYETDWETESGEHDVRAEKSAEAQV